MDFKQVNLVGNGLDLRVLKSLYGLLTSRCRRREQEIPPMLELRPASDLGVGLRYRPGWRMKTEKTLLHNAKLD